MAWEQRGHGQFVLTCSLVIATHGGRSCSSPINLRQSASNDVRCRFARKPKCLELLEGLFVQPIGTVASFAERATLSFANANKLINTFEELKILRETTGHRRNRVFQYGSYMRLFV